MPELPEVETVRRGLEPVLAGARLSKVRQNRPDLRFPFPARFPERLEGAVVERIDRRAKSALTAEPVALIDPAPPRAPSRRSSFRA